MRVYCHDFDNENNNIATSHPISIQIGAKFVETYGIFDQKSTIRCEADKGSDAGNAIDEVTL